MLVPTSDVVWVRRKCTTCDVSYGTSARHKTIRVESHNAQELRTLMMIGSYWTGNSKWTHTRTTSYGGQLYVMHFPHLPIIQLLCSLLWKAVLIGIVQGRETLVGNVKTALILCNFFACEIHPVNITLTHYLGLQQSIDECWISVDIAVTD